MRWPDDKFTEPLAIRHRPKALARLCNVSSRRFNLTNIGEHKSSPGDLKDLLR